MPHIEILHRHTKAIIISGEYASQKEAIEKSRANLSDADLSRADLSRAYLSDAYLSRANLSDANLSDANLSRANLSRAYLSRANLSRADLSDAYLSGANLYSADLSRADLSGADLSRADLSRADLSRADLSGANLYSADLSDAKGINPFACTPLLMLLDQPEGARIRAYKLVNEKSEGHAKGGLQYEIGKRVEVADADTNPNNQCSAGINVATLDWCIREWRDGYRILLVEFLKEAIAAIPTATDGKFRLTSCVPISEVNLEKIGLVKKAQE